jgi:hypothetical protein
MKQGRPKENDEVITKWEMNISDDFGNETKYQFDTDIMQGTVTATTTFAKGYNNPIPEIIPSQKYTTSPVVMVFKTNRKNAKPKIKVFRKNLDDVLFNPQSGVPEDAEILDLGVGSSFIEEFKLKYKL